ncbi:MAG: hypothetical protein H6702_10280 [Myxococcales bacterium]|nr:hypothetical protein [Myxococcales bacterium]
MHPLIRRALPLAALLVACQGETEPAAVDAAGPDAAAVDAVAPDVAPSPDAAVEDGAADADAGWPCDGPYPADVRATCAVDADCAPGDRCVEQPCCACEAGRWTCAEGCLLTVCEPVPACGPDPSGCEGDADCPAGDVCAPDPTCPPVNCRCERGTWVCDAACGGRCQTPVACEGANPQGCTEDAQCADGERCVPDPEGCRSSGCLCDGGAWVCLPDCGGGVCQPAPLCEGPPPAQGCEADRDCGAGARCLPAQRCAPSECECDGDTGAWQCTDDCAPGICQPDGPCGPNPAGCTQVGCPEGQQCVRDADQCAPSSCECDAGSGAWVCTRDCGGGGRCRETR